MLSTSNIAFLGPSGKHVLQEPHQNKKTGANIKTAKFLEPAMMKIKIEIASFCQDCPKDQIKAVYYAI